MDGETSLPSLFANFLLCNSRDARGVVCEPRVDGESVMRLRALGAAGCCSARAG